LGESQRLLRWHYSDLFAILTNEAHFGRADAFVDPGFSRDR
jgi:hypothetical protein